MKKEIWKDVEGYEGFYRVSSLGNVYSLKRGVYLKPGDNGNGYLFVHLWGGKECKIKRIYVHRLVCINFLGLDENKKQVNHKDLNKSNNKLSNLEWSTPRDNNLHRYNHIPSKLKGRGGKTHHNNKKVAQIKQNGSILRVHNSITLASKETNTNLSSISMCCNGRRKKANNYFWKYI